MRRQRKNAAAAPAAAPAEPGTRTLCCVQINVWTGSTYELEPEGGSTLTHLFRGRFGSFETKTEGELRRKALVVQLRRLRPAVLSVNEAPSEQWVHALADELGLQAVWHPGVAVVRAGPIVLPSASLGGNIEEGDAVLFHPALTCEAAVRRRLSGSVYGSRLAVNLGDATQAVGVRLRTPDGLRLVVVSTHWQALPIEDAAGLATATKLEMQKGAEVGAEARRVLREGSMQRLEEAHGVLRTVHTLVRGAEHGGGGVGNNTTPDDTSVLVMGDLNTTPATPEIEALLAPDNVIGGLRDSWADFNASSRQHDERNATVGDAVDQGGVTWDPNQNPHVRRQRASKVGGGGAGAGAPQHGAGAAGMPPTAVAKALAAAMDGQRMRLDYVLVSDKITVRSCRVVMSGDSDGVDAVPSDHYGVAAELVLPSPTRHSSRM